MRCSQERVVLYTMLDESQRDVRLDAVVSNRGTLNFTTFTSIDFERRIVRFLLHFRM